MIQGSWVSMGTPSAEEDSAKVSPFLVTKIRLLQGPTSSKPRVG